MELTIHNTASGKKEVFKPLNPNRVGMYLCGPTVYDYIHIGNARPLVVFDVLYRYLRYKYKEVVYVRNITDVDDKINTRAAEENVSIKQLTTGAIEQFHEDTRMLNCLTPTHEPLATDHIPQMIEIIQMLLDKGYAYFGDYDLDAFEDFTFQVYKSDDARSEKHVYFDVSKMPEYGKFANVVDKNLIAGARVKHSHHKRNPQDFVLWKPSPPELPGWENPFNGRGRPGWHIECSAMSREYLGGSFDLHLGGQDLIFPHHQNEIAQSCCAFPQDSFARYWMHNGYVLSEGEKMSKSLGNFYTVHDLMEKHSASGAQLRLILLQTHYRRPLDFSVHRLEEAQTILDRFYEIMSENQKFTDEYDNDNDNNEVFNYAPAMLEALSDDLNTPLALSHWYQYINSFNKHKNRESYFSMRAGAEMLGLIRKKYEYIPNLSAPDYYSFLHKLKSFSKGSILQNFDKKEQTEVQIKEYFKAKKRKSFDAAEEIKRRLMSKNIDIESRPEFEFFYSDDENLEEKFENYVKSMIEQRAKAKAEKDFATADKIRDDLKLLGIELKDTPTGTTWKVTKKHGAQ